MNIKLLLSSIIIVFSTHAFSQSRCDCSQIVASCSASASVKNNVITITSNTQQCSRVIYEIDGQPKIRTVTDTIAKIEWLGSSKIKNIDVMACDVCVDTNKSARQNSSADNSDTVNMVPNVSGKWRPFYNGKRNESQLITLNQSGKTIRGTAAITDSFDETTSYTSINGNITSEGEIILEMNSLSPKNRFTFTLQKNQLVGYVQYFHPDSRIERYPSTFIRD